MNNVIIGLSGALSLAIAVILALISAQKYEKILTSCIVFALIAGSCFLLFARKVRQPWKIIPIIGLAVALIIILEAILRLFFNLRIGELFS